MKPHKTPHTADSMIEHATAHHDAHEGHQHEAPPDGIDRRAFLKLAGFSVGAAVIAAGCEQPPLQQAVPYLNKPPEMTPGVATWYASTCAGCTAGCGILVKNRDGRPIKIEGNPDHPLSKGGACAIGQASLLGLYDSQRLQTPLAKGKKSSWDQVDAAVMDALRTVRRSGGAVRFLSGTIISPTLLDTVAGFLGSFPDAKHLSYDAISSCAILDAHRATHGARILPRYLFEKAEAIVSIDADFLGTWISPVEFTAGYRAGRKLDGTSPSMSRHVQVESRLSLTGSNADKRFVIGPAQTGAFLGHLAVRLAMLGKESSVSIPSEPSPIPVAELEKLASHLWSKRGKSLVVCGSNRFEDQVLCNIVNQLLGSYGNTIDVTRPSLQKQGSDSAVPELIAEMEQGKIAVILIHGVNPVFDTPDGQRFGELLKRVPLVIAFAEREDETAACAHYVCPDHNPFESWCDAEPVNGIVSVMQPTIRPLGGTRSVLETLSTWTGRKATDHELVQGFWKRALFPRQTAHLSTQKFWDEAVRIGFASLQGGSVSAAWSFAASAFNHGSGVKVSEYTVVLHPQVAMLDGRHAHNPWLQEVPDPVSKLTWENCASVSAATAAKLGVEDGDVIRLTVTVPGGRARGIELPILIQEGQHDGTVAVALGYGRRGTDRFTDIGPQWIEAKPTISRGGLIGVNAAPLLRTDGGCLVYDAPVSSIAKTGARVMLARTQIYQSTQLPRNLTGGSDEPRPLIQETTFAAFAANPASGSFGEHDLATLWPDEHKYTGHRWGLAIDLTACTGCSACVVSCQAENNIPVVGKDEVARNREMQWLRIDRYYTEHAGELRVAHQPVMCQHCGNAPCETVCPVLATVHSEEGLNQQVYNRCVGTRYCANNCPYKIRRFNWFDYRHDDETQNLVLNPDVTIRMRGVMEKCTFCVQRIQEAKIEAKSSGTPIADGAIAPACVQSCPAQAMVFGDMNDPRSRIGRIMKNPRSYRMLEEIGVRPSVQYMTLVRNTDDEHGGATHG